MGNKKTGAIKSNVRINGSASIPGMQRISTDEKISLDSAQIPRMQAAPGASSQSKPAQQSGKKPEKPSN